MAAESVTNNMTKKNTHNEEKNPKRRTRIASLKQTHNHSIAGDREAYVKKALWFVLCGCGLFYYVSLLSFDPFDPSYYTATAPYPDRVANYGGKIGAEVSAHFLTLLGVCAYGIPLFVLWVIFEIKKRSWSNRFSCLLRWLFLTMRGSYGLALACVFANLLAITSQEGGWLGRYLTSWAEVYVGQVGVWMCAFFAAIWSLGPFLASLPVWKQLIAWLRHHQMVLWRRCQIHHLKGWCRDWIRGMWAQLASQKLPQWMERILEGVAQSSTYRSTSQKLRDVFVRPQTTSSLHKRDVAQSLSGSNDMSSNHSSSHSNYDYDIAIQATSQPAVMSHDVALATKTAQSSDTKDHPLTIDDHSSHKSVPEVYPSMDYVKMFKEQTFKHVLFKKDEAAKKTAEVLVSTLEDFSIGGKLVGLQTGPRVRTFEFEPNSGIKQTKITGLVDDIARSLKVESVIIQPIVGKSSMGIQVPRSDPVTVYLGDIVKKHMHAQKDMSLPIGLGISPSGEAMQVDLAAMPHLLIAGATGSGKSVGIHALINSIICARSPREVKMILVDPKMLELSAYSKMPHLACPVITDAQQSCLVLEWAVQEMESRYRLMQEMQVRNISEFNASWNSLSDDDQQQWREHFPNADFMPYLVMIIDELADLMLVAPKDVEGLIQRLSQKARASGIHLVLATQRPSVDVITGVIKANFPARIAFQVVSKHDSRTILDQIGAEKLLGRGDMLFQNPAYIRPQRLQGAYVSDQEIRKLLHSLQNDYDLSYFPSLQKKLLRLEKVNEHTFTTQDPKWEQALKIAEDRGNISASFLQRRLQIGYNRAARMIEAMESQHFIERSTGAKPRAWLGRKIVADGSMVEYNDS